jgi:hypothetical protein
MRNDILVERIVYHIDTGGWEENIEQDLIEEGFDASEVLLQIKSLIQDKMIKRDYGVDDGWLTLLEPSKKWASKREKLKNVR